MSISQASIDELFGEPPAPEARPADAPAPLGQVPASIPDPSTLACQPGPRKPSIKRILGLSVPVAVVLAERDMPIESILETTAGTIIEFEVSFDSELTLQVANRPIGSGQAVKVGENFGLRITRIGGVRDRIDALGGG